jgi:hypothetical protein
MRSENAAQRRLSMTRGNDSEVRGTLIVRGALDQDYEQDRLSNEWVTRIYSSAFAIENRRFVGVPAVGERVNIGPDEAQLDYWAKVVEVDQELDGHLRVIAELDREVQLEEVETNEVSEEYEVLTFYGHASQVSREVVE